MPVCSISNNYTNCYINCIVFFSYYRVSGGFIHKLHLLQAMISEHTSNWLYLLPIYVIV